MSKTIINNLLFKKKRMVFKIQKITRKRFRRTFLKNIKTFLMKIMNNNKVKRSKYKPKMKKVIKKLKMI